MIIDISSKYFSNLKKSIPKFVNFISTKCGIAPTCLIAFDVATKLSGDVITSSFSFTPKALKQIPRAAVPELTAIIYFDLTIFFNSSSNFFTKKLLLDTKVVSIHVFTAIISLLSI